MYVYMLETSFLLSFDCYTGVQWMWSGFDKLAKTVFYKVVVSEAFGVTIKQMNPFAGGHSPIMFSCYSIVMVLSDA